MKSPRIPKVPADRERLALRAILAKAGISPNKGPNGELSPATEWIRENLPSWEELNKRERTDQLQVQRDLLKALD